MQSFPHVGLLVGNLLFLFSQLSHCRNICVGLGHGVFWSDILVSLLFSLVCLYAARDVDQPAITSSAQLTFSPWALQWPWQCLNMSSILLLFLVPFTFLRDSPNSENLIKFARWPKTFSVYLQFLQTLFPSCGSTRPHNIIFSPNWRGEFTRGSRSSQRNSPIKLVNPGVIWFFQVRRTWLKEQCVIYHQQPSSIQSAMLSTHFFSQTTVPTRSTQGVRASTDRYFRIGLVWVAECSPKLVYSAAARRTLFWIWMNAPPPRRRI